MNEFGFPEICKKYARQTIKACGDYTSTDFDIQDFKRALKDAKIRVKK